MREILLLKGHPHGKQGGQNGQDCLETEAEGVLWAFIVFRQGTGEKHSLISCRFASFKFPTCTKGGVRLESCELEISHEGEGARTVNLLVLSLLLTAWKRELGFLISLSRSGEQSMNTLRFWNFKLSKFVILIILCLSGQVAKKCR